MYMISDVGSHEQTSSLLSEVKLLIQLGPHPNIVNLLGAYTQELNKGQFIVYYSIMLSELCILKYVIA